MSDGDSAERGRDRRTFLKQSAAALSAATLAGCGPPDEGPGAGDARPALEPATLRGVADVVLPSELGDEGREAAVRAFEGWLAELEPVAELNHGYGTAEIAYGPPDPAPAWMAQLAALDLEAQKRHDVAFASLPSEAR